MKNACFVTVDSIIFTWFIIAFVDFCVTLVGVFFLGFSEGEIILEYIIERFEMIGYISVSAIYLLIVMYVSKKYKRVFILMMIFLIYNHWYGVFTWFYAFSNIYTPFSIDSTSYQYSLFIPLGMLISINLIFLKFEFCMFNGSVYYNDA